MDIHKILVPIALTDASAKPSQQILQQAAWMARRLDAEVILLHVVTSLDYPYGLLERGHEITARDWHAAAIQSARKRLDETTYPELEGITVTRLLLRGDPAHEIFEAAVSHNAGLIVMATRGYGALYRLLLGSVTAKVLHETQCPVWIGAHLATNVEDTRQEFSIRRVLCSVDLTPHNRHTLRVAVGMAAAIDATLTLVHVTGSVERWGPGGSHIDPAWQEILVGGAAREIAKLQQEVGTNVEVVIESGNVPKMLNRVAEQTKADVLIVGHVPGRSHLGDNGEGYGIIRDSIIPVLSV
jgi:nucleotide-binding universal stress UspA family protein